MKISELIALLEQRKEEYGDVEVKCYECGSYVPVDSLTPISADYPEDGLQIY